jgi:hypothetical protein
VPSAESRVRKGALMIRTALAGLTALFTTTALAEDLPVDERVSQQTIAQTICRREWTRSVRPPAAVGAETKRRMAAEAGVNLKSFVLDHVLPLDLGGAPLDPRNLRLLPMLGPCNARDKYQLEVELSCAVCLGLIGLDDVRAEIWRDWKTYYHDWFGRGCDQ